VARGRDEAALPRPVVREEDGRRVLRVGGVIQSVAVDHSYMPDVWDALLPEAHPGSVLILGLGGGTVATLMTRRWGPLPVTGVERDPAVVWLARHEFGLDRLANLRIVVANAFDFVRDCRETYGAICVDLYVAGKMAHGVLEPRFLRDIGRILAPDGTATFNLWRTPFVDDQIRRIGRKLLVRGIREVDDNILVACGRIMPELAAAEE
jgi:spermidine synthase